MCQDEVAQSTSNERAVPWDLSASRSIRRAESGGMKVDQLKCLKELELENKRLRRAVSDLTLDKQILAEAARGNF